jgi:hypothetical protein
MESKMFAIFWHLKVILSPETAIARAGSGEANGNASIAGKLA